MKIVILLCFCASVALVYSNEHDVEDYLTEFGFHAQSNAFSPRDLADSIRDFQISFKLPVTGRADNETLALMATPRCGRPDNEMEGNGLAYYSPKWHKRDLTYYFASYTNDIGKDDLIKATAKSFKYWSDITPLTFRRVSSGGDIVIAFGGKSHGDDRRRCSSNFDGKGKVLAHATYPTDGRLHFDDDESFALTKWKFWARNYYWVAVHEIGHILGLSHDTNDKNAIMYPYYQSNLFSSLKLGSSDVRRIQNLYGKK